MLPFLKRREQATPGLIVTTRTPDEKPEENQDDPTAAMKACAQDLINAIKADDVQGVADALYDAFDIRESMPEESGSEKESTSPHTYESQQD